MSRRRARGRGWSRGWRARSSSPGGSRCSLPYRFTAVVAEKPKAAEKIAAAIGEPRKCWMDGVPYWIVRVNGSSIVVAPSAGHLFGPYSPRRGYPVLDYEWRPIWEFDKSAAYLKKYYRLLEWILPRAEDYVNACDYDIEGSVIGYMIIKWFGDPSRARRMKFSSLSPVELRRAFQRLQPLDVTMVEAGIARHEMDWLWGINVSRALMHAARAITGKRIILSAGRVQTPTLVEATRRWIEKNLAVPVPTFTLTVEARAGDSIVRFHPSGWSPRTVSEARRIVQYLRRVPRLTVVGVERRRVSIRQPPAFNLGDLQAEASRVHGFSPMKTQKIAEDLYLETLISYPRTNSQKLPPSINYKSIVSSLTRIPNLGALARDLLEETGGILRPVQGRKDDPAHPAIHPTGEKPTRLDRDHWLIYEMIVRRFLAAFASPAIVSRTSIWVVDGEGREYTAKAVVVEREGWMHYYHYLRPRDQEIPPVSEGETLRVERASYTTKWSAQTPPLSKTDLLRWMESQNIGTEATRARILETLYKRGYLESKGKSTVVTDLGMMVSEIIIELFPDLSKPDLTRRFEEYIEAIRLGRMSRREAVEEAKETVATLIDRFQGELERVGRRLAWALGVEEPPRKCSICKREAEILDPFPLCRYHRMAYQRLLAAAPEVAERLEISIEEAVSRIASRRGEAGRWVVEVASLLSSKNKGYTS